MAEFESCVAERRRRTFAEQIGKGRARSRSYRNSRISRVDRRGSFFRSINAIAHSGRCIRIWQTARRRLRPNRCPFQLDGFLRDRRSKIGNRRGRWIHAHDGNIGSLGRSPRRKPRFHHERRPPAKVALQIFRIQFNGNENATFVRVLAHERGWDSNESILLFDGSRLGRRSARRDKFPVDIEREWRTEPFVIFGFCRQRERQINAGPQLASAQPSHSDRRRSVTRGWLARRSTSRGERSDTYPDEKPDNRNSGPRPARTSAELSFRSSHFHSDYLAATECSG